MLCRLAGLPASGREAADGFPEPLAAEQFILDNLTNHAGVDLADQPASHGSSTLPDRTIRGEFLEWLLAGHVQLLSHDGLRLKNAVIESPLDLSSFEVAVPAWFNGCQFNQKVGLSGAHFDYDLGFIGCVFEDEVTASGLRVDGSLALKTCELKPAWKIAFTNPPPGPGDLAGFFHADETNHPWLSENAALTDDPDRKVRCWHLQDPRPPGTLTTQWTNGFTATAWGGQLFMVEDYDQVQEQVANHVVGLTLGPLTNWMGVNGSLDLNSVRTGLANVLQTNTAYILTNVLTGGAFSSPAFIRWTFDQTRATNAAPMVAVWEPANPEVQFYRHTVFRKKASFDRAVIGGKWDGGEVEFQQDLYARSLKVGDDLLMNQARLDGAANFTFAQIGHDFFASESLFGDFDASGMITGGSLLIENARFRAKATFAQVSVGLHLKGAYARFEDRDSPADFSGLSINGFVDFQRAQFKGPASFILAHVKGDFQAPGATFEDHRDFRNLAALAISSGNNSTFNADFGGMAVDGFAIFENVLFARSASFRNAHFSNLYLDGTRWPEDSVLMGYTNEPTRTNLLRLEAMDFTTIRDVSGSQFLHTKAQLKESEANLVAMFGSLSPYSFDTYDKLEDFFQRQGAPGLADQVFIAAKQRERLESSPFHWLVNVLLEVTVGYGRKPWLAFCESLAVVVILGGMYFFCMEGKNPEEHGRRLFRRRWRLVLAAYFSWVEPERFPLSLAAAVFFRRLALAIFFSLGMFLPIIDLGARDIFDIKSHKTWIRYLIAAEQILGFILVPLWTIALSGLIK
jgi:hypothetical protein